jgi:hypothetical protein
MRSTPRSTTRWQSSEKRVLSFEFTGHRRKPMAGFILGNRNVELPRKHGQFHGMHRVVIIFTVLLQFSLSAETRWCAGSGHDIRMPAEVVNEWRSGCTASWEMPTENSIWRKFGDDLFFISPSNLVREAESEDFQQCVTELTNSGSKPIRKPEFRLLVLTNDSKWELGFICASNTLKSPLTRRFVERVTRYFRQRSEGHSREYALASLQEFPVPPTNFSGTMRDVQRQNYLIPDKWLRDSTNILEPPVIIDGPIAWQLGQSASGMRFDAQEFDPKLSATFKAAEVEAEANLTRNGTTKGLGYCHVFWQEKQRILRTKHAIKWHTPAELNPNAIFD